MKPCFVRKEVLELKNNLLVGESVLRISVISKIQLVVYYQYCVLIG